MHSKRIYLEKIKVGGMERERRELTNEEWCSRRRKGQKNKHEHESAWERGEREKEWKKIYAQKCHVMSTLHCNRKKGARNKHILSLVHTE